MKSFLELCTWNRRRAAGCLQSVTSNLRRLRAEWQRCHSLSTKHPQSSFCIWLRVSLFALGRVKAQTFCNCPRNWTGLFHHGKTLKWNEWHILVCGNGICSARWQPARAPIQFFQIVGFRHLCESLLVISVRGFWLLWPERIWRLLLYCLPARSESAPRCQTPIQFWSGFQRSAGDLLTSGSSAESGLI